MHSLLSSQAYLYLCPVSVYWITTGWAQQYRFQEENAPAGAEDRHLVRGHSAEKNVRGEK